MWNIGAVKVNVLMQSIIISIIFSTTLMQLISSIDLIWTSRPGVLQIVYS